jgi:UDP-N-acetylglucosamine diphosphorylase/glucosamine-1-phosphate N-acetyltransferase
MLRVALFEDSRADQLRPLALTRPVFELLSGLQTNRERVLRQLGTTDWSAFCRTDLAETYREAHPGIPVNDERVVSSGPVLFVNGRYIPATGALAGAAADEAGYLGETLCYVTVSPDEAILLRAESLDASLAQIARDRKIVTAQGRVVERLWDLVHHNGEQITADYRQRAKGPKKAALGSQVAILGEDQDVHVDPTAQIDPFVVIDARSGPVYIDAGAKIQAFTRLEGPCYVGPKTQLFRANVREGCSFGPVCRVGGEIEESIILGYSNKYHDGFLGHSYVGSWVNLGALTTNSDLKNDYSNVTVPLVAGDDPIDTGSTKVGAFIGDHTKTALSTLFNTGSSVGVMTMLLPAGELMPKLIPSFMRLWHGRLSELPGGIQPSLDAARIAMGRRDCVLTPAMERLLVRLFDQTRGERKAALDRARQREARAADALRP